MDIHNIVSYFLQPIAVYDVLFQHTVNKYRWTMKFEGLSPYPIILAWRTQYKESTSTLATQYSFSYLYYWYLYWVKYLRHTKPTFGVWKGVLLFSQYNRTTHSIQNLCCILYGYHAVVKYISNTIASTDIPVQYSYRYSVFVLYYLYCTFTTYEYHPCTSTEYTYRTEYSVSHNCTVRHKYSFCTYEYRYSTGTCIVQVVHL